VIAGFSDVTSVKRVEKCHEDEPGNTDKQVRQVIHTPINDIQGLNDDSNPDPEEQDQPKGMLEDGKIAPFAIHGHILFSSRFLGLRS
jgi:hypothetical protein